MKRFRTLILALTVVIVTAAGLSPVLDNGFVNLDDNVLVYDNTKIMNFSPGSVGRMFTAFHANLYHPLVLLSYAVEYRFFRAEPGVYHATNYFLHLFNCLLVFWLLYLLTANALPAFFVALLFGIHPMHVESVAWISERKDVLYAFFFLLSLVYYVRYVKTGRKRRYFAALSAFVLSLLSKPMAITLPPVLILFDFMLGVRQPARRRILEKLPFFAIAGVFAWTTMIGQYPDHQGRLLASATLLRNFLVACHDLLFYLWKAVLPVKLSVLYPAAIPPGSPPGPLLYAPFALLFIVAAVIFSLRYTRKVLYGFLFFFLTILPVINLVPVGLGIAADRYTYVPYIGLFYVFAAGIVWLLASVPRSAWVQKGTLAASLGILFSGFIFASWQRTGVWNNDFSLYGDIIENYKNVPIAYNNRGFAHICKGDYERALADCAAAARLAPRYFDALNNLGNIYIAKRDFAVAEYYFTKARDVNPSHESVPVSFGNLCKHRGDYARALSYYRQALAVNARCDRAYYNIGEVHRIKGDYAQALREYSAALAVNPYNTPARFARADLLMQMKDYDAAIADYTHIVEHRPSSHAYCRRGLAYEKKAAYDKAVRDFTQAIRIDNDCAEAYGRRAVAYYHKNERSRSTDDARKALELGYRVSPELLTQLTEPGTSGKERRR